LLTECSPIPATNPVVPINLCEILLQIATGGVSIMKTRNDKVIATAELVHEITDDILLLKEEVGTLRKELKDLKEQFTDVKGVVSDHRRYK